MLVHPIGVRLVPKPGATFFFVQMVRLTVGDGGACPLKWDNILEWRGTPVYPTTVLTDALGRFNLPVTFSEKQLSTLKCCENRR